MREAVSSWASENSRLPMGASHGPSAAVALHCTAPTLCAMRWWWLFLSMSLCVALRAGDATPDPVDEAESEKTYVDTLQKQAAAYRLGAVNHVPSQAEEVGALYHLTHARQLLADQSLWLNEWRATRTVEKGFERYPYSSYAGELLLLGMECCLRRHKLGDAYEKLLMLWFYLPDYPRTGLAMDEILAAVEREQSFSKSVHLEQENPSDVISIQGHASLSSADKILSFLALHGDRFTVAPQAELGLARALLLSGTREDLLAARRAYEEFLEKYPNIDLTFNALLEHALSYLVGYRGDDYDNGALVYASAIIDQAELETSGDEAKAAEIRAYRTRIRLWQQDRDLKIARWYLERGNPLTAWFKNPPGLRDWLAGARYYLQAVKARDSSSPQGREAARLLSELPAEGSIR